MSPWQIVPPGTFSLNYLCNKNMKKNENLSNVCVKNFILIFSTIHIFHNFEITFFSSLLRQSLFQFYFIIFHFCDMEFNFSPLQHDARLSDSINTINVDFQKH